MRTAKHIQFSIALAILGGWLSGCTTASHAAPQVTPEVRAQEADNIRQTVNPSSIGQSMSLGPGDIFEVRVYDEKDLTNVYRVSDSGFINFPLVGSLNVNRLTSHQLTLLLESKLTEYLKTPQVSVFIKEFNSKKIYVFGQVRKPGTFGYEDGMSIVQAITLAGGFQPVADPNGTYVNRVVSGNEQKIKVAVEDIGRGKAPNLVLEPGDIVYVPESIF